jgi:restriction system protein
MSLLLLLNGAQVKAQAAQQEMPELLIPASILAFGDKTQEGQLILSVKTAWFDLLKAIEADPEFIYCIDPRKLEELIAGGYEREHWDVILTPRSGDKGRDVIATKPGFGQVRIYDQVKRYAPGHIVTADEVRSLVGVLTIQGNVSKAVLTTTTSFAPKVYEEVKHLMPYRLELKNGNQLRDWLGDVGTRPQ